MAPPGIGSAGVVLLVRNVPRAHSEAAVARDPENVSIVEGRESNAHVDVVFDSRGQCELSRLVHARDARCVASWGDA